MAELSELNFQGKYNSGVSGLFKSTGTQAITAARLMEFVTDVKDSFWNSVTELQGLVTASGTDTYTVTGGGSGGGLTSYATGYTIFVKFTNANTGAATLNVNALGANAIVKSGSVALAAGDILDGQILLLQYDGTNFQIIGGGGSEVGITSVDGGTI